MKITPIYCAKMLKEIVSMGDKDEKMNNLTLFAKFLVKNKQVKNLQKIIISFSKIWNQANGVAEVEVLSKYEIDINKKNEIEQYIKKNYNAKTVEIKYEIDPSIKGGIIVRVEDTVFDASVDKQYKELQKYLTA